MYFFFSKTIKLPINHSHFTACTSCRPPLTLVLFAFPPETTINSAHTFAARTFTHNGSSSSSTQKLCLHRSCCSHGVFGIYGACRCVSSSLRRPTERDSNFYADAPDVSAEPQRLLWGEHVVGTQNQWSCADDAAQNSKLVCMWLCVCVCVYIWF